METTFNLAMIFYFAALFCAAINLFRASRFLAGIVTAFLSGGALLQIVYIGLRWLRAGRPPFSNMFESLVLFAWAIVAVYFVLRFAMGHIAGLSAATALLAALTLAYASTYESDIKPLMPALQSNWLTAHVFSCFLGYGGFAVSFVAAAGYLIAARSGSRIKAETRDALEIATAKTIAFGFLFLTIGIITGAVWANSAWGTYWSWDPKETWSLITWLIYAVFLHCRFMRGWKGKKAAWIALLGFAAVLFTYFGVNFIMSGLHSYAS